MSVNATDRGDAAVEGSLVRAPSHQPHSSTLVHTTSHHAHFDVPNEGDEDHHNPPQRSVIDIEHVPVDDDPRAWSSRKKTFVLVLMSVAVLGPMISPSVYNPVIDEVKSDLRGSETQIGLSLSIFILIQGCFPVVWATIAEIIGRKPVYIVSFVIYTVASAVGSRSPTMPVLIGMRCLQAVGSSAVLALGAGSLADMYEVEERGKKLGLYYGTPMLGPTLGPLIGGALGNAYGWRATLYFLAVFAFIMTLLFFLFPDTWRKERSKLYQKAVSDALKRSLKAQAHAEKKRQRKLAKGLASTATTPALTAPPTGAHTPATRPGSTHNGSDTHVDLEAGAATPRKRRMPKWWPLGPTDDPEDIKPELRDINPIPMVISTFASPTNFVILVSSGVLFAAQYTSTYTAAVTFSRAPYNYNPLIIGVVCLSFGVGNILGSVVGGRLSDRILQRLKAKNGGVSVPEFRLMSTLPFIPFMVISFLIYAWTSDKKTNIAGPVVGLFCAGFSIMLAYASLLAYLVDSNPGRSASAISCNSFCRGIGACVMSQVAIPIQNAIGDGGLYTLIAGLIALAGGGIIVIAYKGEQWRSPDHRWAWSKDKGGEKGKAAEVVSYATSHTAIEPAGDKEKA
ncbi:Quinidine resistance protein 3 [Vanrija pseudolonga]|nr:Quinidine resistance protein 3 [Vanrija pseudolonga]